MYHAMTKVKEVIKARRRAEEQAKEDGRRVERKPRMKVRRLCCACGEKEVVRSDGTYACGHMRCAECLESESISNAPWVQP